MYALKGSVSRAIKHPAFMAVFALSSIASAFFIEWAADAFFEDKIYLIYGVGLTSFIVVVASLTHALLSRLAAKEFFEEKAEELRSIIVDSNLSWLVSEKYVKSLEDHSETIWVFTPNMKNDINYEGDIFDAVESNLRLGKKYTYFVPSNPEIYAAISKYLAQHKPAEGQVKFCMVPPEVFLFYTEAVIYNARSESLKTIAIEWLPVDQLNFYVEMDDDHANKLIGVAETLIHKYGVITSLTEKNVEL